MEFSEKKSLVLCEIEIIDLFVFFCVGLCYIIKRNSIKIKSDALSVFN